ncbi:hypothetical protein [Phytohabitans rumicis]|uniref:Uncharacterized protein n=1 Tax=Phytohabitans rumicis TaxID=1076125 RepID=A0A6V8KYF3_9ACTN|nr:hypothetical protein [Phytohabitans rumicis]GFJ90142.1 hypothetical protein Prum_037840 [Phytohabitans rumicis]
MLVETEEISSMIAQIQRLAAEDPEAAQKLVADLTATLDRAGVRIDSTYLSEPEVECG